MELANLLTLIDKVSASELGSFSFEEGSLKISMKRKKEKYIVTEIGAATPAAAAPAAAEQKQSPAAAEEVVGEQVLAPLVGTFYNASSPDAEPFVKVGDTVKQGQVLGIIEAMKLMNEIECEYDGVVAAVLAENESMVEYGQPLFVIR